MVVPDNASLALTKFDRFPPPTEFNSKVNKLKFEAAAACTPSQGYRDAFDRWKRRIEELPGRTLAATFAVDGRMVVGIGAANILQSSVTMNRLWGMPLIPGSALKGLASHYAASRLSSDVSPDQQLDLFGDTELSGCITWLDAWYVLEPPTSTPFTLDVVTPHHQTYYQNAANPPWDFEDPIPSNFISVRGTFLVAVQAPDENWAYAAMDILTRALKHAGVGAKTNAGYGRMTFVAYQSPWFAAAQQAAAEQKAADERLARAQQHFQDLIARIDAETGDLGQHAHSWYEHWASLTDEAQKTQAGRRIVQRWKERESVYNRLVFGKPGSSRPKDQPKRYALDIVAWLEEHSPKVSKP